jgi:hypothetical protein
VAVVRAGRGVEAVVAVDGRGGVDVSGGGVVGNDGDGDGDGDVDGVDGGAWAAGAAVERLHAAAWAAGLVLDVVRTPGGARLRAREA